MPRKTKAGMAPLSVLRQTAFIDLERCVNDVNGNPRGVFRLRGKDGSTVALFERDYGYDTPDSLARGVAEVIGRPVRGCCTFDVSAGDVTRTKEWSGELFYRLPAARYKRRPFDADDNYTPNAYARIVEVVQG